MSVFLFVVRSLFVPKFLIPSVHVLEPRLDLCRIRRHFLVKGSQARSKSPNSDVTHLQNLFGTVTSASIYPPSTSRGDENRAGQGLSSPQQLTVSSKWKNDWTIIASRPLLPSFKPLSTRIALYPLNTSADLHYPPFSAKVFVNRFHCLQNSLFVTVHKTNIRTDTQPTTDCALCSVLCALCYVCCAFIRSALCFASQPACSLAAWRRFDSQPNYHHHYHTGVHWPSVSG